ncbi:MAG: DUF1549 and DUF1553 domain-containing protein, partial [Planctomycetales bacterium]
REVPENNYLDELVHRKLRRVKVLPSGLCGDADFLRRVHLDLTGLPPEPDAIPAFLADRRPTKVKRDEVIGELIGGRDFVEHWTNRWASLLQVNRKYLGEPGAFAFRNWIRQSVASNMPGDAFVRALLTSRGSTLENPPAAFHKIHRDPGAASETATQLFLGIRFQCNKCHDHPFERWTQKQYFSLGAYFARVGRKPVPLPLRDAPSDEDDDPAAAEEIIFDKDSGEFHDARPAFPFEAETVIHPTAARREQVAAWITSPDNPFFARNRVNRVWSYLLGVGLIDPVDDFRAGNPPSNPELLDRLAEEYVRGGFNDQQLIREICESRAYQRALETNRWNRDDETNYARALPRRLTAETLIDTINRAIGAKIRYAGMPQGTRAAELPDASVETPDGFLDLFGRPSRESACECDRNNGVALNHALALINGPLIGKAVGSRFNRIAKIIQAEENDAEAVEEIFLAILCRLPTKSEIELGVQALRATEDRLHGARDLTWALLNTPAFLFNR